VVNVYRQLCCLYDGIQKRVIYTAAGGQYKSASSLMVKRFF